MHTGRSFQHTHTIVMQRFGQTERIEVDAGMPDLIGCNGVPLYTRNEAETFDNADWEYSENAGLTFQGEFPVCDSLFLRRTL